MCPGKFQAHHPLLKELKIKQLNFKHVCSMIPWMFSASGTENVSLAVWTLQSTDCLLSPEGLSKILYLKHLQNISVRCKSNIPFQWCSKSKTSAFCFSYTLGPASSALLIPRIALLPLLTLWEFQGNREGSLAPVHHCFVLLSVVCCFYSYGRWNIDIWQVPEGK